MYLHRFTFICYSSIWASFTLLMCLFPVAYCFFYNLFYGKCLRFLLTAQHFATCIKGGFYLLIIIPEKVCIAVKISLFFFFLSFFLSFLLSKNVKYFVTSKEEWRLCSQV